jgi:hypothetical protein
MSSQIGLRASWLGRVVACACILVVTGCASSKPLTWSGPKILEGKGGLTEKVEGIDFYTSGSPLGRFEVLSVVETHHYTGGNLVWNSMSDGSSKSKAIKEAKRLGADAVVPYDFRESRFGGGSTAKASVRCDYLIVKLVSAAGVEHASR